MITIIHFVLSLLLLLLLSLSFLPGLCVVDLHVSGYIRCNFSMRIAKQRIVRDFHCVNKLVICDLSPAGEPERSTIREKKRKKHLLLSWYPGQGWNSGSVGNRELRNSHQHGLGDCVCNPQRKNWPFPSGKNLALINLIYFYNSILQYM